MPSNILTSPSVDSLSHSPSRCCSTVSILNLPSELLCPILQDVLNDVSIYITSRMTRDEVKSDWQSKLAILSTCRRLREEAIPVLQATLRLTVSDLPRYGSEVFRSDISLRSLPLVITDNMHTFVSCTGPLPHLQDYFDLFPAMQWFDLWTDVSLNVIPLDQPHPLLATLAPRQDNPQVPPWTNGRDGMRRDMLVNTFLYLRDPANDANIYERFEEGINEPQIWSSVGHSWATDKPRVHQFRELLRPLRRSSRRPCWRPKGKRECEFRVWFGVLDRPWASIYLPCQNDIAITIDPFKQCVVDRFIGFKTKDRKDVHREDFWIPGRDVLLVTEGVPHATLWYPKNNLFICLDPFDRSQNNPRPADTSLFRDEEFAEFVTASALRCG